MIASRAAPTPKSLPRQRVDIALYQIHPYLHEQNPMSRECGHGSSSNYFQYQNYLSHLPDVAFSGRQREGRRILTGSTSGSLQRGTV